MGVSSSSTTIGLKEVPRICVIVDGLTPGTKPAFPRRFFGVENGLEGVSRDQGENILDREKEHWREEDVFFWVVGGSESRKFCLAVVNWS
jgi:hypothetical protein